ncbi:MAG: PorV/PorQ family protein [Ignavibacteriaceae bacterium]|nr:PorV/PorQ family protein [Ignavibacteriaceae bacterium]
MRVKLLFILFTLACLIQAQEFKKTATAGFVFLQLPVTAKSAGTGETSVSFSDLNSSSIFSNPAGMGFSELTHSFSASYSPWFADIKHLAASYSYNTNFGVFGVGVTAVDFGTMKRTKRIAGQSVYEVLGDFSASALAVSFGYSRMLTDRFSFGLAVKYVREGIDSYTAENVVLDGGVLYYTGLGSLRIGAALQNFGTEAKYINDPFKMPSVLKLGLAAEVLGDMKSEYRITAITEALHPNDGDERINAGFELAWKNLIFVRGGYKFFTDEESYSFGFGINPGLQIPMQIDFAFADYGRLGNIMRFSLNLGYN